MYFSGRVEVKVLPEVLEDHSFTVATAGGAVVLFNRTEYILLYTLSNTQMYTIAFTYTNTNTVFTK